MNKKQLELIFYLFMIFIVSSYFLIFNNDIFIFDDAYMSLISIDLGGVESGVYVKDRYPLIVFKAGESVFPILHHERHGTLAYNIVRLLLKFFPVREAITYYHHLCHISLALLFFLFAKKMSQKFYSSTVLSCIFFYTSTWFVFNFDPYITEKLIPIFVLIIHLILFNKNRFSLYFGGGLFGLLLFFLKVNFIWEIIGIIFIHFFSNKKEDLLAFLKFIAGFTVGCIPFFYFNLYNLYPVWVQNIGDITRKGQLSLSNVNSIFEFVFNPNSFYLYNFFDNVYENWFFEALSISSLIIALCFTIFKEFQLNERYKLSSRILLIITITFFFIFFSLDRYNKLYLNHYFSGLIIYLPFMFTGIFKYIHNLAFRKISFLIFILIIFFNFIVIHINSMSSPFSVNKSLNHQKMIALELKRHKIKTLISLKEEFPKFRLFDQKMKVFWLEDIPMNINEIKSSNQLGFIYTQKKQVENFAIINDLGQKYYKNFTTKTEGIEGTDQIITILRRK